MARIFSLSFDSELSAPAPLVWEAIGTMRGVNAELRPWLRMSAPPEAATLRIEDAPIAEPLFASWVLLLGAIPIDRHFFMIAEVDRGRGFIERSTSWLEAEWEHRRFVEPRGEAACLLSDRLRFEPRLAFAGPIVQRIVAAVFRHRHRRLRERFGAQPPNSL